MAASLLVAKLSVTVSVSSMESSWTPAFVFVSSSLGWADDGEALSLDNARIGWSGLGTFSSDGGDELAAVEGATVAVEAVADATIEVAPVVAGTLGLGVISALLLQRFREGNAPVRYE